MSVHEATWGDEPPAQERVPRRTSVRETLDQWQQTARGELVEPAHEIARETAAAVAKRLARLKEIGEQFAQRARDAATPEGLNAAREKWDAFTTSIGEQFADLQKMLDWRALGPSVPRSDPRYPVLAEAYATLERSFIELDRSITTDVYLTKLRSALVLFEGILTPSVRSLGDRLAHQSFEGAMESLLTSAPDDEQHQLMRTTREMVSQEIGDMVEAYIEGAALRLLRGEEHQHVDALGDTHIGEYPPRIEEFSNLLTFVASFHAEAAANPEKHEVITSERLKTIETQLRRMLAREIEIQATSLDADRFRHPLIELRPEVPHHDTRHTVGEQFAHSTREVFETVSRTISGIASHLFVSGPAWTRSDLRSQTPDEKSHRLFELMRYVSELTPTDEQAVRTILQAVGSQTTLDISTIREEALYALYADAHLLAEDAATVRTYFPTFSVTHSRDSDAMKEMLGASFWKSLPHLTWQELAVQAGHLYEVGLLDSLDGMHDLRGLMRAKLEIVYATYGFGEAVKAEQMLSQEVREHLGLDQFVRRHPQFHYDKDTAEGLLRIAETENNGTAFINTHLERLRTFYAAMFTIGGIEEVVAYTNELGNRCNLDTNARRSLLASSTGAFPAFDREVRARIKALSDLDIGGCLHEVRTLLDNGLGDTLRAGEQRALRGAIQNKLRLAFEVSSLHALRLLDHMEHNGLDRLVGPTMRAYWRDGLTHGDTLALNENFMPEDKVYGVPVGGR